MVAEVRRVEENNKVLMASNYSEQIVAGRKMRGYENELLILGVAARDVKF